MNIALPALVIFVLLLPGFIARSKLKLIERTLFDYSPFGTVVMQAIGWGVFLHGIFITSIHFLTPYYLKTEIVFKLLISDANSQNLAISFISSQSNLIFQYFGLLLLLSFVLPLLLRHLITYYKLDSKNSRLQKFCRFNDAPWYYLFSGADFNKGEEPDAISISAIIEVSGVAYLYNGILEDYFLDQDGNPDRLILTSVMRRHLSKDKNNVVGSTDIDTHDHIKRFYTIDGDYFVLRYSEIITLNIEYIQLTEATFEVASEIITPIA